MSARIPLLCIFLLISVEGFSQAPGIEWKKCLGGSKDDFAHSIQQTTDNGFIIAGSSDSGDGDVTGNLGGTTDFWIEKLESNGNLLWEKSLGGSKTDFAFSIQQIDGGGFIVAGTSGSNDNDVSGNHDYNGFPSWDYWIVKLDEAGNLVWQKCLGGSNEDEAFSVQQTADDGFIVAGSSNSNDGDVSGNHDNNGYPSLDYWIVKLDESGNLVWQKSLGGSDNDVAYSIQQTYDGGFIATGFSSSNDGDISGNHGGNDYWVVRLDANGNLLWQKSLGGSDIDESYSVRQTTNGDFIVIGFSQSNDGDISGNHGIADYWMVKLDPVGNIVWQKTYGGSSLDFAYSIQQTFDSGFIVAGSSYSNDGDISSNHGVDDYWILKLDTAGNLSWQKSIGGSCNEDIYSIEQTSEGGFIVAGWTCSNDGDVSGNHGGWDCWIVKLSSDTLSGISSPLENSISISLNPSTGVFQIQNSISHFQTVEAFNLLGEKVFYSSNLPPSNSLDLSSQPDGVYFLHLKTKEGIVVKKVVISR